MQTTKNKQTNKTSLVPSNEKDRDLKLKCLELSCSLFGKTSNQETILEIAKRFSDFVYFAN